MFAAIAPRYDRLNHLLSMQVDRYWRWRTARRIAKPGCGPILDVCTGTGDLAFAFDRRTRGTASIVGADFCRPMLEIGERKAVRRGVEDRVRFIEADALALPFDADSFAVVSVAFGLRNLADTDLGLCEMRRVCRPGGTVAVLEFSRPARQPFAALYGWYFRAVLPRIGQWLARNADDAYGYLPASVAAFPSGRELADRMERAGLHDVRWQAFTLGVATLYIGRKRGGWKRDG
ncbi:MAG: bifunctional demethylmenaquinone methyltransferase/2-methoxy-6-polyprenyl-1,4-benzoquinol methylase UbiE [Planctomycetes bacterium]|nr:bifunctional demethylmenaquinone methyltransferase/2-methoxy-6-polyprenyl-1,4-benzoquinol methylase UbiE [Planctomycetota bacterium]